MCEIKIIKVRGKSLEPESITVIGEVQRCFSGIENEQRLIVQIICPLETIALLGPNLPFQGTTINASSVFVRNNGTWLATFDNIGDCRCGGQMLVTAECATDKTCRAEMLVEALECVACPVVQKPNSDVVGLPVPECSSDATAVVALSKFFTNSTPNPVLFQIEPGHPDGVIVSGGSNSLNAGESGGVTAVVRYPTLSFPQPFVVASDLTGELLGCPPWPITLGPMPACCPDVVITNVEVDGCMVVVNVEPLNVPLGCEYYWNFDAAQPDGVWETGNNSQRVHHYDKKGQYTIQVRVACGSCRSDVVETEVEITECETDDPWYCGFVRTASVVAAALAIVALVLIQCVPKAAPALIVAAGAAALVSALSGLLFWLKCKRKTCNLALLLAGQGMLGGGSALLILSLCCPWVLWTGLGIFTAGLVLLLLWKSRCNASYCQLAAQIIFISATILPLIGAALAAIPVLQACQNYWANFGLAIFYAAWGVKLARCSKD